MDTQNLMDIEHTKAELRQKIDELKVASNFFTTMAASLQTTIRMHENLIVPSTRHAELDDKIFHQTYKTHMAIVNAALDYWHIKNEIEALRESYKADLKAIGEDADIDYNALEEVKP